MWRTRWKHGFVKSVSYTYIRIYIYYIYIPVSWNWLPTLACQSHFTHDTRRKEHILPFLEDISQKERFLDIATSWCVLCVMLLQMLLQPSTKKNIIQKHGFVLEMLASSGLSKHAETKACTTLLCHLMRRGLRKHRCAKEHMDKTGRSTLCPCLGTWCKSKAFPFGLFKFGLWKCFPTIWENTLEAAWD